MSATQVQYQDIPQEKLQAKILTNWSSQDVWVLSIILLLATATGIWLDRTASLTVAFVITLIELMILLPLLYRAANGLGRLYAEIGDGIKSGILMGPLEGYFWRADDKSGRFARWLRHRLFPKGAIPLRLGQVTAVVNGDTYRYGLLHQTDRPYDHLLIAVSSAGFARMNVNAQQQAKDELASITNRVIAEADLTLGMSYLRATGPYDPSEFMQYLALNGNPLVARPEKFEMDEETQSWANWMHEYSKQLLPTVQANGAGKPWYVMVITIKRTSEWRQARSGKLSNEQIYDLPIVELGRSMVESLRSSSRLQMTNVRVLGLAELAMMVRCSWDVVGIFDYFRRRSLGLIPRSDEEIEAIRKEYGDNAVDAALEAWPQKRIQVGKTGEGVWFDDNFIVVRRTTKLPKQALAADLIGIHYLAPAGVWTRQSSVGESISGSAETRNLVIGESALVNFQTAFASNRVVQNPRWAQKRRQIQQSTASVSAHSIVQNFNQFQAVVHPDERLAFKRAKEIGARTLDHGVKTEPVKVPYRMVDLFVSSCLGINRL